MSKPLGLHCWSCGKRMLRTVDTRPAKDAVSRIKTCASCGAEMATIEKVTGQLNRKRRRKGEAV